MEGIVNGWHREGRNNRIVLHDAFFTSLAMQRSFFVMQIERVRSFSLSFFADCDIADFFEDERKHTTNKSTLVCPVCGAKLDICITSKR